MSGSGNKHSEWHYPDAEQTYFIVSHMSKLDYKMFLTGSTHRCQEIIKKQGRGEFSN